MTRPKTGFYPTFFVTLTIATALSACKTSGREPGSVKAMSSVNGNPDGSSYGIVESDFVIPKAKFAENITQNLVTRRAAEDLRIQELPRGGCPKTESLTNRLVTKLIAGTRLEQVVGQTPRLALIVDCGNKTLKLPETKAGVIWVYPELLKGFSTEDQLAALIAHELVHYTRSHEEEIEERLNSWMPFREDAVNRSRWEQEKEADRLSTRLVANAGFDPYAVADVASLVDKLLTGTPGWKQGKINFPLDSADERGFRAQFEMKQQKLRQSAQTVGQTPAVKEELDARP